jgi:glycerophosphoryl diester phosphodiesterase
MAPFDQRLLFGHRGACAHERENTMAAFTRAITDGANALETDAHLSRDAHVMLVHDPELLRVFGRDARVLELTRAELEVLGVPALSDVLAAFPSTPINIDVKQREPRMERAIVEVIERAGQASRVLLTSFFDDVVHAVRATGYGGPTGLAYREIVRLYALPQLVSSVWRVRGARAQVPPRSGRAQFATRGFIDKCHALGIAVDFWVVNEVEEARSLLALGADGLMSDDPGAIAPAFAPHR